MATYHCSVKTSSRSSGGSSVASDAYREGKKIKEERTGLTHDYTRKSDVIESMTMTPNNAPNDFKESDVLWNTVEASESRKDARLFREVEVSLPIELPHSENKKLVTDYVQRNFIDKGMCATISFHGSRDKENPHAHIMLTTRKVDENGFGQKNRDWDKRELVTEWRKEWADSLNSALERNDINQRVDHRSYQDQGIAKTPMIHLGKVASAIERRGVESERGDINRGIERENIQSQKLNKTIETGIDRVNQLFEQHQAQKAAEQAQNVLALQQAAMQRQTQERLATERREAERAKERANEQENDCEWSM